MNGFDRAPSLGGGWVRLAGTVSILAIMASGAANAQTEAVKTAPTTSVTDQVKTGPDTVAEIVVTGTQIRGIAPVGAPVISVGQKDIVDSGLTTVSDIIHDIPQVSYVGPGQNSPGGSYAAQNANQNVNKSNSINIRGIGDQATLVLLDGRRLAPGGSGAALFDPSSIPAIALGRIEVVADGASAIYGSDAVAGVANLILRKNFAGLELTAQGGWGSDYNFQQFGGIFGKTWNGGSIMIAAEYDANSQILQSQRQNLFLCNQIPFGAAKTSCTLGQSPANVVTVAGTNGLPSGVYGLPGGAGTGITAGQLSATPNYAPTPIDQSIVPQNTRASIVGSAHQDITSKLTIWGEGYATARDFLYAGGAPTISSVIPQTNPNYIPGFSKETASYALTNEIGAANTAGFTKGGQIAGGFNYNVNRNWELTGYVAHSWDQELRVLRDVPNNAEVAAALACTTPGICLNPFGTSGNTPAVLDSFLGEGRYNSHYSLDEASAKIDGSLFHLPGGDVKIAIGGEVHEDKLRLYNFNNTASPNLASIVVIGNTSAKRTVASAFGELVAPLVGPDNARTGLESLVFDVAGRYDHYNDVGGTLNPKVGVNWKPIQDLVIHASYGTSFRAPSLGDVNPAGAAVYGAVNTPTSVLPNQWVITELGGNSSLKPETSTTYTVGFDYNPSWLPGAHASVTYYNLDYKGIISTPGQNCLGTNAYQLPACTAYFVPASAPGFAALVSSAESQIYFNQPAPSATGGPFIKGVTPVGGILEETKQNAGGAKMEGLDLEAEYRWKSNFGAWFVRGTGSYVIHYLYAPVPGAPYVDVVNTLNNPLRFRARVQLGWSDGGFSANAFLNYTNPYQINAALPNVVGDSNIPNQNQSVSAYTTVDATLIYRTGTQSTSPFIRNTTFTVALINAFDKGPPFALAGNAFEFDPGAASPIGRTVSIEVRKGF